ncbi:MAG: hypothetical protein AAFW82_06020 [Pseudomonadota bacterium]
MSIISVFLETRVSGGLIPFSTFLLEVFMLSERADIGLALIYIPDSVVLSTAAFASSYPGTSYPGIWAPIP